MVRPVGIIGNSESEFRRRDIVNELIRHAATMSKVSNVGVNKSSRKLLMDTDAELTEGDTLANRPLWHFRGTE